MLYQNDMFGYCQKRNIGYPEMGIEGDEISAA